MEEQGHLEIPRIMNQQQSGTKLKLAIIGGIALFLAIFTIAIIVDSVHTIEEGNVGIYFVQGALHDTYTYPGVHWAAPFMTTIAEVTIRPQTMILGKD